METRMRGFGAEVDRAICPSTVTNSGPLRKPADRHSICTIKLGTLCYNTFYSYFFELKMCYDILMVCTPARVGQPYNDTWRISRTYQSFSLRVCRREKTQDHS